MTNNFATRNSCKVLLIFMIVSIALRFFSFFPSVLDNDESTYMIIGRDILHGKELYSEVTDTKPVGIFLAYAGLEFVFGSSIFWKRFAFAILVAVTAFIISRISKKMFQQDKVATAAGLIYILYTSIWTYYGRSPNTELLFNFFTSLSFLLLLKKSIWNYTFAGLFMGMGFMVKYLVLFDLAAFLLFFLIIEMKERENRSDWRIWGRHVICGLCFLVPFALTNLYFWHSDHFADFYFVTYELPGNYGSDPSVLRYIVMLLDFTSRFLPISFLVFYVVFGKNRIVEPQQKGLFILWIASILVAIYLPGKAFHHYTIQLMLPLSLLAALFFHTDFKTDRITGKIFSKKYGIPALLVVMLAIQAISFQNEIIDPDYEQQVADYLAKNMDKDDDLYVANYNQILYYLLKEDSPTKFIHSTLLFKDSHKAFNINAKQEIRRIIKTSPEFVVVRNSNKTVEDLIRCDYRVVKMFNNQRIKLYEKKE
ncbi:MAG: ArnT family glycosyltransferase [Draconibacterium sp.]